MCEQIEQSKNVAHPNGLCQKRVHACVEATLLVRFSAISRYADDDGTLSNGSRTFTNGANGTSGFDSAHAGHFFVHEDEFEVCAFERRERFAAIAHTRDGVTAVLQDRRQEVAIVSTVFSDEDAQLL